MDEKQRKSEPKRLGQIFPVVMEDIEKRVDVRDKMSETKSQNNKSWQFNRQINVSVLVQLVFLASLIVGSWVNLQRQLDLLQRDVTMLLQCQKDFTNKLETLSAKSISYEYRLRAIERQIRKNDTEHEIF